MRVKFELFGNAVMSDLTCITYWSSAWSGGISARIQDFAPRLGFQRGSSDSKSCAMMRVRGICHGNNVIRYLLGVLVVVEVAEVALDRMCLPGS